MDAVEYIAVTFTADLEDTSPYKAPPSNTINEAWDSLINQPMILIDELSMMAINQSLKTAKGINRGYYAMVEVYHELHCLNLIRKFIWRDEYSEDMAFQGTKDEVMNHVVFTETGSNSSPRPRFSTQRTCRNFTAITQWVNDHDADLLDYIGTPRLVK
ncbi:hypothetical protein CHU98_g5851 [Xylaria longipes]|nr:hypothetical protein CHU98_g5851 [Xylaria longipes]